MSTNTTSHRAPSRVAEAFQAADFSLLVFVSDEAAHTITVGPCPDDRWQATCGNQRVSVLARASSRELVAAIATQWALVVGRWV